MDTKKLVIIFAATALTATTVISCSHHSKNTSETAETVDVAIPIVDTVTLSTVYPGYLTANSSVNVVAKVNGQITSKTFDGGSMVEKGKVLFTIDPSDYNDQVSQAQASLTTAISNRDYAKAHYEAVKKALESEAVSKMEVVQAESDYHQAEASIKNARAALDNANRLLSYCTIEAPITGMVTDNTLSTGNYVTGQSSPVTMATIYDTSTVSANFAIEDDRLHDIINSLALKDSLDFKKIPVEFEEPLPHDYTGEISYVAPNLNNSTGTLKLKCRIQNPYRELRPGMYVKVNLPYSKLPDAILVRDAALGSDQLGKYLYVVNDSNKVVYTPVEVGPLYQDSLRVITKGLKPTDKYVTKAMLKVRSGMTVNPRITK